ncbi:unnamed protein product [Amoebophrya sp. A25]|nr:unnamed protein product [Amoebophrya sp. A25]|eukprot:GSA25T00007040001.1
MLSFFQHLLLSLSWCGIVLQFGGVLAVERISTPHDEFLQRSDKSSDTTGRRKDGNNQTSSSGTTSSSTTIPVASASSKINTTRTSSNGTSLSLSEHERNTTGGNREPIAAAAPASRTDGEPEEQDPPVTLLQEASSSTEQKPAKASDAHLEVHGVSTHKRALPEAPARASTVDIDGSKVVEAAGPTVQTVVLPTDEGHKETDIQSIEHIEVVQTSSAVFIRMVLERVGLVINIASQLAPLQRILQMHKEQRVGSLSPFPFISGLSCNSLWLLYSLLIREPVLVLSNLSGLCWNCYYVWSFNKWCQRDAEKRALFLQQLQIVVLLFLLGVITGGFFSIESLGSLASAVLMVLLCGPLLQFPNVYVTKDVGPLGAPEMAIANLASCVIWCVVGYFFFQKPSVWIPHLIGGNIALGSCFMFATIGKAKVKRRWRKWLRDGPGGPGHATQFHGEDEDRQRSRSNDSKNPEVVGSEDQALGEATAHFEYPISNSINRCDRTSVSSMDSWESGDSQLSMTHRV